MKGTSKITFRRFGEKLFQHSGKETLIESGFNTLDTAIEGFRPGNLYFIGGRPGMGKTSLMLDMSINIASEYKPVYIFSLDESEKQLFKKLIAKILTSEFTLGEKTLYDREKNIISCMNFAASLPIYICNVNSIQEIAEAIKEEIRDGIIFIDYLQLISEGDDYQNGHKNWSTRQDFLYRSLKKLAVQSGLPVVVMSQLSRDIEFRVDKHPTIKDVKCESIIENSDVIILMYCADYYRHFENNNERKTELIIEKNIHGSLGTAFVRYRHTKSSIL